MNTNKSRLFVIELLLVIFLFSALFASNIINRFIVMLGILLITIITNYSLKKMNKKSIFDKRVTLLMVIFAIIYISIFYLLGLYYGFESNKYLLSFGNLFRVVIPLGIIIVSSEILRNNLINQNGKIKIKGKLFDLSLISFDFQDGKIMISKKLNSRDKELCNLGDSYANISTPNEKPPTNTAMLGVAVLGEAIIGGVK